MVIVINNHWDTRGNEKEMEKEGGGSQWMWWEREEMGSGEWERDRVDDVDDVDGAMLSNEKINGVASTTLSIWSIVIRQPSLIGASLANKNLQESHRIPTENGPQSSRSQNIPKHPIGIGWNGPRRNCRSAKFLRIARRIPSVIASKNRRVGEGEERRGGRGEGGWSYANSQNSKMRCCHIYLFPFSKVSLLSVAFFRRQGRGLCHVVRLIKSI